MRLICFISLHLTLICVQVFNQRHVPPFGSQMVVPQALVLNHLPEEYKNHERPGFGMIPGPSADNTSQRCPPLNRCSGGDHGGQYYLNRGRPEKSEVAAPRKQRVDDREWPSLVNTETPSLHDISIQRDSSRSHTQEHTTSASGRIPNLEPSSRTGNADGILLSGVGPRQAAVGQAAKNMSSGNFQDRPGGYMNNLPPSCGRETGTSCIQGEGPESQAHANVEQSHTSKPVYGSAAPAESGANCMISKEKVKLAFGESSYQELRHAILRQQDTFVQQLWELHRLAYVQSLKAAMAVEEPEAVVVEGPGMYNTLDRTRAAELKAQTLQVMLSMGHLPASVKSESSTAAISIFESQPAAGTCCKPVPVSLGSKSPCLERWLASQARLFTSSGIAVPPSIPTRPTVTSNTYAAMDGMCSSLLISHVALKASPVARADFIGCQS